MKLKFKTVFILFIIVTSMFIIQSCKPSARLEISELYASAIKVIGEEKSNFSAFVSIFNETSGIEVEVEGWSFKVYSENTMLFDVTNDNYNDFICNVAATTPTPGYYTNGLLVITLGIPAYKAYVAEVDVFKGKKPDRLDFFCTVRDINGNISELSKTITITYAEVEPGAE